MASVISLMLNEILLSVSLGARLDITFWTHKEKPKRHPGFVPYIPVHFPMFTYSKNWYVQLICAFCPQVLHTRKNTIYGQLSKRYVAELTQPTEQLRISSLDQIHPPNFLTFFLINQNLNPPQWHSAKIWLTWTHIPEQHTWSLYKIQKFNTSI